MVCLPSFTKYYWAAWLAACCLYFSTVFFAPLRTNLGWFALVTGIGGVYVFHFELGRLLGFLKTHSPDQFAKLPNSRAFEILAFFHPALLRTFWPHKDLPHNAYGCAIVVYRSAWFFSLFAVTFLFVLAIVLK